MHSQLLPPVAVALPPGSEDETGGFPQKIINLDLGIGSSADSSERGLTRNKKIKQEKKVPLFTAAQFQELYNQILIYNYIALGLPVAFHLLLPSWMSVFNSLGPAIYKKYPSFAKLSAHKSDCMDSEPGRCRRTDGRKWRCSKNVIPQQKYCERHMHRGRQGSRKHVEAIKRTDNITSLRNKMPKMSDKITISSTPPCSNYRIGVPATRGNEIHDAKHTTVHASTSSNSKNDAKSSSDEANPRRKQTGATNSSVGGFVSSRFGLSPKSVLHSSAGKPVSQCTGNKKAIESEAERCRRTDGKKWQCRRGALPNQKYCEAHMHRGARKLVSTPQYRGNLDNGINLNTVPTSPQQHTTGNNSTSSMSDATTITDENINS